MSGDSINKPYYEVLSWSKLFSKFCKTEKFTLRKAFKAPVGQENSFESVFGRGHDVGLDDVKNLRKALKLDMSDKAFKKLMMGPREAWADITSDAGTTQDLTPQFLLYQSWRKSNLRGPQIN